MKPIYDAERVQSLADARRIIGPIACSFAGYISPIYQKLDRVDQYLRKQQDALLKEVLR